MTTKDRYNYSSGISREPLRGYSRAVVVGDSLYVSGTTAMDHKGEVIGGNDPYEQTRYVISVLRKILAKAGFEMKDVVRTRLFVTNMLQWDSIAKAHSEVFDKVRPASSIVQVTRLVDPRLLVEMEAEAVRGANLIDTIAL